MNLNKLLEEKKSAFLKRWFNLIVETYPDETTRFLKHQKDRFANPVGHALTEALDRLYEEVVSGVDPQRAAPALDQIIRIRAIQDFFPSQAVAFVFFLKTVIRDALEEDIKQSGIKEELLIIETRIDQLALLAFDQYMACREKLYDLKANEQRRQTFRLLQRAKIIGESPASDLNSEEDNDGTV